MKLLEQLGGIGALIFVGSVTTAMASVWLSTISRQQTPIRFRWAVGVTIGGAIIGAIGGALSQVEGGRAQQALQDRNDEIVRLNKELALSITGGDSFAYLAIVGRNENRPMIVAVHQGKYTIYDLSVRIVDLAKFDSITAAQNYSMDDLARAETRMGIGNLNPEQARPLGRLPLPGTGEDYNMNVFFMARNGGWTQLIRMRRVANSWTVASQVRREGATSTILWEKVDAEFPKGTDGRVVW